MQLRPKRTVVYREEDVESAEEYMPIRPREAEFLTEMHIKPRRKYEPISPKEVEVYTEEHTKLLGSYTNEWKLFRDGYYPDGRRIYDLVNGKSCHQCSQKTLGERTSCSLCQTHFGEFCGDCLFMRYGENILEAKVNAKWICPVCRGICNCNACRIKRGWEPVGNVYRNALAQGFSSVAHFLVMKHQRQPQLSEGYAGKESIGADQSEDVVAVK